MHQEYDQLIENQDPNTTRNKLIRRRLDIVLIAIIL